MTKTKTKDYVLRAHNNYVHKKDRIPVISPAGTVERIRSFIGQNGSVNAYINQLISADLDARENASKSPEEKPVEVKPENESDLPWNNL